MKFKITPKWMVYYPNTERCQMFGTEEEAQEFARAANRLSRSTPEMRAKVKDLLSFSDEVFKSKQPCLPPPKKGSSLDDLVNRK